MTEIIYKRATDHRCLFEVYNAKGCGFLEPVYHECLAIEFEHQRIRQFPNHHSHSAIRGRSTTGLPAGFRLLR